jgi:hypothetical protein
MAIHVGYWATLGLLLSACSQVPDRARHTVEDYRSDRALRDETLRACANDPGSLGKTSDCVNAESAAAFEGAGSLRNLPSMKLDPSKNPLKSSNPDPANSTGSDSRYPP